MKSFVDILKLPFHIEEKIKISALKQYLDEHNNNPTTVCCKRRYFTYIR